MKLTKKIEKEIINLMEDYWNQYLTGKIEPWSKYLVDNYRNIGGTEEEIWNSKKEILDYTYGVIDQMKDKVQLRNKTIQIIPYAPYFMVHELLDMYVIIDGDWSFYGKFRLSSLIQKFGIDWKVLHQHGSFPDSKTQKGEAFAVDVLKAENIKLQKAVKNRTIELEAKNRELEIEGALERIRSQAVAMKVSSDLLDIVVTMRNEFIKLGHEAHYFWHMMWLPKTYEKAMTSGDGSKIGFVMTLPRHMHGDIPLIANWEKSKKPTIVYTFTTEESIDYVDKMVALGDFKNIDPQAPSHEDLKHIEGLTFIMARTTHGEIGYSLPGIVKNPPKEDLEILVRFAGAFDLAHQRFLDLQKAEKQARETLIELSLERIRSRVTAMQESSDLFNVVVAMRKEFNSLGHEADYFWHMKWTKDNYEMSMTSEDGSRLGMIITVPKFVHKDITTLAAWEKSKKPSFVLALNAKEAWNYIDNMNTHGKYKQADPHAPSKEDIEHIGGLTFIIARTTHGEIGFSLAGKIENPPKASIDTLVRFAQVFDLAYKRFEDLQKAEAQTRETEIELALEKVRSRSLAMHKSEELNEVVSVIFEKLKELKIPATAVGIGIYIDGSKDLNSYVCGENEDGLVITNYRLPYFNNKISKALCNLRENQLNFFVGDYTKAVKNSFYKYILQHTPEFRHLPDDIKSMIFNSSSYTITMVGGNHAIFNINDFEGNVLSNDDVIIIKRFAKVFDQAYTRFLDLQKAETQAREANIEAALERVRSHSMGMQSTDDFGAVTTEMFNQLRNLGEDLFATGIVFCDKHEGHVEQWHSIPNGGMLSPFIVPIDLDYIHQYRYDQWKKGEELFSIEIPSDFIEQHFEDIFNLPSAQVALKDLESRNAPMPAAPTWEIDYGASFKNGYILASSLQHFENIDILPRFANVFEQTYTRFLDLKKAEAQAREAQIETALEKVRSRTMAMQKGEEVKDVVVLLYKELIALGVTNFATCGYVEINEETKRQETWVTSPGGDSLGLFYLPLTGDVHFDARYKAWKKQQTVFHQTVAGKERRKHLEYAITTFNSKEAEEMVLTQFPDPTVFYCFNFSHGYLHLVAGSQLTKEEETLLARFTRVFEQTYARFQDLKKAEEQTRTAQINLAVERVRAKALAMHKSEEIIEVVAKLKDEVMGLDIPDVVAATIFLNEGKDKVRMWDLSSLEHDDNYLEVPFDITFKIKKTDPHLYVKRVWENPENFFVEKQDEKDFKRLMQWLRELHKNEIADEVEDFIEKTQLKRLYHSAIKLNSGKLVIDQLTHPSDEMETILTKMGAAFDLAYKRFEDLKNAEAQTREAQIEAAIERVRSKSMAMHKSSELRDVVNTLHIEFRSLNLNFHVAAIQLFLDETKDLDLWIATDDGLYSDIIHWPYVDLRVLNEMNKARKSKTNIEILLSKSETKEFLDEYFKLDGTPQERKAALSSVELVDIIAFYQANTGIFIIRYSEGTYTEEEKNITQRFSKVFEQSYTRFLDLQKAEEQAREAQIETSLERVRSRTLAMQTSEELAETSVIVFKQLLELGIAPNRLFIGIVKSDNDTIEAWTTNEDGSKLAIHFSPQASKNKSIKKMLDGWKQQKKSIIIDMKGKELESYFRYLNEDMKIPFIDGLKQKRRVQTIAYFSGGLIGMAAAEEQPNDTIHLLERFAAVFNLTYTRFKDLKIAEANAEKAKQDLIKLQAAKKSAEEALTELQLTQNQLIQSEKMASLGELTAGIAHEIQNPLNFVNNFSEVSKELLDEMIEELENGDIEEVKAITDDVIQNLEKINHHGKRADGIVKGMLQHSRASGDKKEATNINALADEYLRLAYHGLRAKDKSFNAQLVTDFDKSITTVDVIPQDLGRVVLNLLTNAFYAVNEKKRSGLENYEPTVSISTKKVKNNIVIKVKDNGNGIPKKVLDKIFQPFFTTKPTGQGTGLGLSMSYDIVTKGHRGQLKVNTALNKGTEFIIELPV